MTTSLMANGAIGLSLILAVATMAQTIIGSTAPSLAAADEIPDHIESTSSFSYGAGDILANGDYKLRLKDDCELVLLKNEEVIWTSDSRRSYLPCVLSFQADGNLVIYSTNYVPQWASGSARDDEADYILALTEFGNLAIYGPVIWETKTGSDPDDGDAMLQRQQHRRMGPQAVRVPRRARNVSRMLHLGGAVRVLVVTS